MAIIETKNWLYEYLKGRTGFLEYDKGLQRNIFCNYLSPYFPTVAEDVLYQHLLQNGLFIPNRFDNDRIQTICMANYWEVADKQLKKLKLDWNGPDIPVFIFPLTAANEQLRFDLGGKTGLAHSDKILLFVSPETTSEELRALLTHEYNHVCRLNYLHQEENSINLLDGMLMEGLAEIAVLSEFGEEFLAKWATLYPIEVAVDYWQKDYIPHLHVKRKHGLYKELMYGETSQTKWMGYTIGFHIVSSFSKDTDKTICAILQYPTEKILCKTAFWSMLDEKNRASIERLF